MRKRIAFFNRSFWPDTEATGQLLHELCVDLNAQWDVTVVTGQPNSVTQQANFTRRGRQMVDGISVHRLSHTTFPKRNKLGRAANLCSFTYQARRWCKSADHYDVLVSETDPFFLPLIVAAHARRTGSKFIMYLQDVYPDIAIALGVVRESPLTRIIRSRLLAAYRQADRIIVLDDDMRERLVRWGLPSEKFAIVPNWVDIKLIRPIRPRNAFREKNRLENRFVVMHSGNMGLSQQLDRVVQAAADSAWPDEAVLTLVGDGAKRHELEQVAQSLRQGRIAFFDYQPRDQLAESLSAADLHLICMDARIRGCLAPSKLYGILASGSPVLAIVPEDNSVARIVREHDLGFVCQEAHPRAIAEAVRAAVLKRSELVAMGARARRLAETEYDRAICSRKFGEECERVLMGTV